MATNISTILNWFRTGKTPTQQQFWDSWQSFWHKDEIIPHAQISKKNIKLVTTDTYTFVAGDADYIIHFLNDNPVVAYMPAGLPENLRFEGVQVGTGQITFRRAADSAVIIRCTISEVTKSLEQYSDFTIDFMGVDTYLVYGKLAVKKQYENTFVSTWNTANVGTGSTTATQIKLPLVESGTYDLVVDWGDGTTSEITTFNQPEATHDYSVPGIYKVSIKGILIGWSFGWVAADKDKILSIEFWGDLQPGDIGYNFQGCTNLKLDTVKDKLNLSINTSMKYMFSKCANLISINLIEQWDTSTINNMAGVFWQSPKFNQSLNGWDTSNVISMVSLFREASLFNGDISSWDVGAVKDMSLMFYLALNFNQPLNSWNVSNVTNLTQTFGRAFAFNQPLDNWDVSKVSSMQNMFRGAAGNSMSFNQDINNWDVSNVTNMSYMFAYNQLFNQPLNSWNIGKVTTLSAMFYVCPVFDQDLNNWNTASVIDMGYLFDSCTNFNGNVSTWNVSNVTSMSQTFSSCANFNQPLNSWDVGNCINMYSMFYHAGKFNQPLYNWNTHKVTAMGVMFYHAAVFNQDISMWDTSKVTSFQQMFVHAQQFNQSIGAWNTSSCTSMWNMFNGAIAFNQPLNDWDTSNVTSMVAMFQNATAFNQDISTWAILKVMQWTDFMAGKTDSNYSSTYYDALLQSWSSQNVKPGISINFGTIKYTSAGNAGRNLLVSDKQWIITDGGLVI
jgi:surface protein